MREPPGVPGGSGLSHAARAARHEAVAASLASLADRQVDRLVAEGAVLGSGIGGTTALVHVDDAPVFVKRVPLTDLERDNVGSTANHFRLPTCYQYGIGSAGFGVWRELAAHTMTTGWALQGRWESVPLLYHWRVLDHPPRHPTAAERAELTRSVAYWDHSPPVRARLEAIARSSASVLLFCEHIPQTLHRWLTERVASGDDDTVAAACALVERWLRADIPAMNAHGLLHFDAHFGNILTDGRRLYLADFGLATSARFDLSDAERDFLGHNSSHDACYAVTHLVNWLVTALAGAASRDERVAYLRRCAEGRPPAGIAPPVAAVIRRYAPVAVVMNDFYGRLHGHSRTTPYPAGEIRLVCDEIGLDLA